MYIFIYIYIIMYLCIFMCMKYVYNTRIWDAQSQELVDPVRDDGSGHSLWPRGALRGLALATAVGSLVLTMAKLMTNVRLEMGWDSGKLEAQEIELIG